MRQLIVALMLVTLSTSCASERVVQTYRPSMTEGMSNPERAPESVVGYWQGTTYVNSCMGAEPGRCGAEQIVAMSIVSKGKQGLGGYYKCAYGNQTCLGQNNTGHIVAVSVDQSSLTVRVVMPDATSCLFMGRMAGAVIKGNYICYAGGSIQEQGAWNASKLY
jgi:hypothetical protein